MPGKKHKEKLEISWCLNSSKRSRGCEKRETERDRREGKLYILRNLEAVSL